MCVCVCVDMSVHVFVCKCAEQIHRSKVGMCPLSCLPLTNENVYSVSYQQPPTLANEWNQVEWLGTVSLAGMYYASYTEEVDSYSSYMSKKGDLAVDRYVALLSLGCARDMWSPLLFSL
jgi:hypothetical protein